MAETGETQSGTGSSDILHAVQGKFPLFRAINHRQHPFSL